MTDIPEARILSALSSKPLILSDLYRHAGINGRGSLERLEEDGLVNIETKVRRNFTKYRTIAKAERLLAEGVVDFRFHTVIISLTRAGAEAWRLNRLG